MPIFSTFYIQYILIYRCQYDYIFFSGTKKTSVKMMCVCLFVCLSGWTYDAQNKLKDLLLLLLCQCEKNISYFFLINTFDLSIFVFTHHINYHYIFSFLKKKMCKERKKGKKLLSTPLIRVPQNSCVRFCW